MEANKRRRGIYERFIKRALDMILSGVALIVAILVKTKLGSPVIFKQERPGLNEKIFKMYKFRSMTDAKDENGELLPDEERLTSFGKKLRSTSLDELPELFNIFKGDMSIVGPRPLLVQYLNRYNQEQRKRHLTRPGITGLAQVEGRNSLSWQDKFQFDISYVNDITFLLDVKIVLKTIKVVFKKEGINSQNAATMEEFKGNNE